MKLSLTATGLLLLLVSASCQAITLKLDPEIELLVLDGRKISGSLLKGAGSLELDRGQHQFLFRVEKPGADAAHFQSVPMIVTFSASAHSVAIRLPALTNRRERTTFDKTLNFQLIDERGIEITSLRDHLPKPGDNDFEKAMVNYNRDAHAASVPRFALHSLSASEAQLNLDYAWQGVSDLPSLQGWFKRFDAATRLRFISWMKTLRTS
ncbi:YccT family protein [Pantoea endophytica]